MCLIDIHCHVLPSVDDGPANLEEARKILDESVRQNICCMIMTPHYRKGIIEPSRQQVAESFYTLQKEAAERGIQLFLGCEYYRDSEISENIRSGRSIKLADTSYVLVEFSVMDSFTYIRNYTYKLKVEGYQPTIAHVERYNSCWHIDRICELKECGIEIQVNAATILGKHGLKNKKMSLKLMKNDLINYIASDTHGIIERTQNLKKCSDYVAKKMGNSYMKKIFYENPSNILRSR